MQETRGKCYRYHGAEEGKEDKAEKQQVRRADIQREKKTVVEKVYAEKPGEEDIKLNKCWWGDKKEETIRIEKQRMSASPP